ncbi:26S proteasome non-ATPase regulatory subunit 6 [Rhizoctonia solani]|uniref:26S proteasome non-ATPase regulatory subunit 6 n=1 Tax=Rhizoctonia solani TaxID=456999 RepID=A0A8H8T1N5_9AGAM|nr:26S proteasome non-ATPase regulatory subunit 6 [Rhizoctonia solani]QRW25994.1 26S proteasome non-ATPase regulatory subunit 6 [Rhizoctonia solani]
MPTPRMNIRSINGCYTCKNRKKKCDETHPQCLRCIGMGIQCGGYPPLENPDSRGVMRRARPILPATGTKRGTTFKMVMPGSTKYTASHVSSSTTSSVAAGRSQTTNEERNISTEPQGQMSTFSQFPDPPSQPGHSSTADTTQTSLMQQPVVPTQSRDMGYATGQLPASSDRRPHGSSSGSSAGASSLEIVHSHTPSNHLEEVHIHPSQGQPGPAYGVPAFEHTWNELSVPTQSRPLDSLFSVSASGSGSGSGSRSSGSLPSLSFSPSEDEESASDDEDPEGVGIVMCTIPTPDPHAQSNTLPFVLQSYARWANFSVFEPSRIAYQLRDNILARFSSSQASRNRVILIANAITAIGRDAKFTIRSTSIVAILYDEAQQSIAHVTSKQPASRRELDIPLASMSFDHLSRCSSYNVGHWGQGTLWVSCMLPHRYFDELVPSLQSSWLASLAYCWNLHSIIDNSLRAMSSLPSEETWDRIAREDGLQWLRGLPGQFLVLLAWINGLCEEFGTNVDPQILAEIETRIRSARFAPGVSSDPILTVRRLAVKECWRQTVFVYLYMALCGAGADDPRVAQAVKAFTRIINGVKPGHNPDTFLLIPMHVVGVAARRRKDRDSIRRRIFGLQKGANSGTPPHTALLKLTDIWERTEVENRAAVWSDLRVMAMEGLYSEYQDDMEGVVSGAGPSASAETQKPVKRNIIVDDQHPFDLELYISSYKGQAAIKRLRFIAANSATLQADALRLAIDQVKSTNIDVNLYHQLVTEYNALPSVHKQITLDQDWMAKVKTAKDAEGDRLQVELKTYTTNLIKESTRMAYRDLGNFYRSFGDTANALKHYSKGRESCTTAGHVLQMNMAAVELLVEQLNFAQIYSYVFKAESALESASAGGAGTGKGADKADAEYERARSKLQLASGIAQLGQGNFQKAAWTFLKLEKNVDDWLGTLVAPADIAIYGTLAALATLSRSQIKASVVESDTFTYFIEQEPYIREIIDAYTNNNFKVVLELLDRHSSRHGLDVVLAPHIGLLTSLIRDRALVLYTTPFTSIRLQRLAEAFGITLSDVEAHIVRLVREGQVKGRVDANEKVLIATQVDPRAELFQRALKAGVENEATARKLILRMKLIQNDLVVKTSKSQQQRVGPPAQDEEMGSIVEVQ